MTLKKPPDPSASRLPSPQRQETDKRGGTALACAQHPAPFLPSLAESRYSLFTTPVQLFRAPSAPVRARPTAPRGSSTFSHCTYQAEKPAAEKGGNRVKRRGIRGWKGRAYVCPPPWISSSFGRRRRRCCPQPRERPRGSPRRWGRGGTPYPRGTGIFRCLRAPSAPPPPPKQSSLIKSQ